MRKRITSVMLAVGLITALGIAPAFAITIDTGQDDAKQVLDPGDTPGEFHDAHGPACGAAGCPNNGSDVGDPFLYPAGLADNDISEGGDPALDGANIGAWNAVFSGTNSDGNSAIISP